MKTIAIVLFRMSYLLRKLANRMSANDQWRNTLSRWKADNQDVNLRLHYPEIENKSLVLDLGGYQGQWASDIYAIYQCDIYVFEPHLPFFEKIQNRFEQNPYIHAYPFGLGDSYAKQTICIDGDATSFHKEGERSIEIEIRSIKDFFADKKIDKVDLMKINIEGGEYDLLDEMIACGLVRKVRNIQIQFHYFVLNSKQRMEAIQQQLSKTHHLTYQYEFLWENWQLE